MSDKIRNYRKKVGHSETLKKIFRTGYKKKCLGSGVKIRHGRATGTTYIFCFGLIISVCVGGGGGVDTGNCRFAAAVIILNEIT